MSKGILTKRERDVFELLIINKTTRQIATDLGISEKTVRNHISNAMQKLGVKGRAGAVVELLKLNEISTGITTAPMEMVIWKDGFSSKE